MGPHFPDCDVRMNRSVCAAVNLSDVDRQSLAIRALSGAETVSALAERHDVSRKFLYQITRKGSTALDDAFLPNATDAEEKVLIMQPVSGRWLKQMTLVCHSSYRGVTEAMLDLLGIRINQGTVHNSWLHSGPPTSTASRTCPPSAWARSHANRCAWASA
jgi:transposase-like protein